MSHSYGFHKPDFLLLKDPFRSLLPLLNHLFSANLFTKIRFSFTSLISQETTCLKLDYSVSPFVEAKMVLVQDIQMTDMVSSPVSPTQTNALKESDVQMKKLPSFDSKGIIVEEKRHDPMGMTEIEDALRSCADQKPTTVYCCPKCHRKTESSRAMTLHFRRAHPNDKMPKRSAGIRHPVKRSRISKKGPRGPPGKFKRSIPEEAQQFTAWFSYIDLTMVES